MLNQITLQGRLTKDPELRQTQNGTAVATFVLACERDYGEEKATDFFPVVAWRGTAEFVSKYFVKGNMAIVTGRLQNRQWEKDGVKRTVSEVIADHVYFGQAKATQSAAEPEWTEATLEDESGLPF